MGTARVHNAIKTPNGPSSPNLTHPRARAWGPGDLVPLEGAQLISSREAAYGQTARCRGEPCIVTPSRAYLLPLAIGWRVPFKQQGLSGLNFHW